MVAGTADKFFIVFNMQNPQTEFKRIASPLKYQTRCLTVFPDQQDFLVGSIKGRVGVHHLDESQQSKNFTFKCHRHMERLQQRDLTVPSIFGTKIANRGLSDIKWNADMLFNNVACFENGSFLAAYSTMMSQSMHMRFVLIGARMQKIIIHQLHKHTFTCTSHRSLEVKGKPRIGGSGRK